MSEQITWNITEDKKQQINELMAVLLIKRLCEQGHLPYEVHLRVKSRMNQ